MRSIFWKIFLSFWLVMALVVGLTLTVSMQVASERSAQVNETRRIDLLRGADEAVVAGGAAGFARWLADEAVLPPAQTIYLVDLDGNDILSRPLPADVRSGFKKHKRIGARRAGRLPRIVTDDSEYLFFFGPSKPPLFGTLSTPVVQRAVLVFALLASALVCWLLTRYLTAPLTPVTRAAARLAEGELDARTGAARYRNDELGRLAAQFDQMAQALQQHVEARQDLLRNVSHELRSPLARLQVALELARRQPDEIERHLQRIEQEALHMETLTAQILELARAQAVPDTDDSVDLGALLRAIQADASFEGELSGKRVQLSLPDTVVHVRANESLLRSAIENVVRNALRFSPDNGEVNLVLDAQRAARQAVIRVNDDGPGVAEPELARIFQPFYQADGERDGSGVGLAVTAQVLELYDGEVEARNRSADGGLLVTMRLPLVDSRRAPARA